MASLENDSSTDSPQTDTDNSPERVFKRGEFFPSFRIWVVIGPTVLAVLFLRSLDSFDHAIANIVTLVGSFISLVALFNWFVFYSGYSRLARRLVFVSPLLLLVLGVATLRIEHVSSEMVPRFKWAWSPAADRLLDRPVSIAASVPVDISKTTPDDFSQFLGRERRAAVEHLSLSRDWKSHPPELLWRRKIGAGWGGFSVVNGFAFTMEQRGDEEWVSCYSIDSGDLLWRQSSAARHETTLGGVGPRSTPTIDQGQVYALGATGLLRVLEGTSGMEIKTLDLRELANISAEQESKQVAWGRSNSPLIVDTLVVVPLGGASKSTRSSLIAFDKTSLEEVWRSGDRQISYSSPTVGVLDGVRQIVSVNENNVTGHEITGGKVLWTVDWPGSSNASANTSQPVILEGNRLLLSKGYGQGAKLMHIVREEDQSGENQKWRVTELWSNPRVMKTKFTNVVIYDEHIYGLSDGILECVDLASGKRNWKKGRFGHGQILRVGDLLLVQAEKGDVVLVELSPERLKELGRFKALNGKTWTTLCLYGDKLLVRNAREAACYRLPLSEATALLSAE